MYFGPNTNRRDGEDLSRTESFYLVIFKKNPAKRGQNTIKCLKVSGVKRNRTTLLSARVKVRKKQRKEDRKKSLFAPSSIQVRCLSPDWTEQIHAERRAQQEQHCR